MKFKISMVAIAALIVGASLTQSAMAQTTTLRNPLIPGAESSPPFVAPPEGPPPAPGDGPTPAPVTPGMGGPPTLLPWVPAVPADQIDIGNSGIPLPVGPPVETPPGVLGPALTGFVPESPSTPGPDPGMLTTFDGYNPAIELNVNPGGGLPGTGGYYTTIPKIRRGGQQTHQWELRGRNSIFGGGGDGSQDEVTLTGPLAGFGLPFGVPTGNGYNKGPAGSNNDLRNSAIDLGGGMTMKVGGVKIPLGSTILDWGNSATRGNGIGALNAHQSTEFGQGFRSNGVFSNVTTDFGFPYTQFAPANVGYQKTGQLLNPNAVETNF